MRMMMISLATFAVFAGAQLEAATNVAPEDGGPRHWEVKGASSGLNLREQPSISSKVLLSYPRGTILTNLGCQNVDGIVWCDVQKLGGGERGFVSAKYLKPAVAPDGSVPVGPDDSASRAGQKDFDATDSAGVVSSAQVEHALHFASSEQARWLQQVLMNIMNYWLVALQSNALYEPAMERTLYFVSESFLLLLASIDKEVSCTIFAPIWAV